MTPQSLGRTQMSRIQELDFLKLIMILFMVSFHLVYIGDTYPYAKQIVYTFHMPVFLIISGYLMNVCKPPRRFLRSVWWLLVPYTVMESGYVVMASMLPIREHIEQLTPAVFLEKLLIHPLGPYWYLHTLILCELTYYGTFMLTRLSLLSRYIIIGVAFAWMSHIGILTLSLALFFLAGAVVRHSGLQFLQVVRPSWLSALPFVLLAVHPANLSTGTAGGSLMVYLVMSLSLSVYPMLSQWQLRPLLFIGRNTLPVFLFSPMFTILCKPLVPALSFEPTGLLFLVVSLLVCISGSLLVCLLMDVCRVSPYFFGRSSGLA